MKTEEAHIIKAITKFDDKLSLLDTAASLFPIQKIIFGILADKNRPMTPGQIASEYYSRLSDNIVMNWKLCNAANQIVDWYLRLENPIARTPAGVNLKPIRDKPLDGLSLNLTSNDYSAKLEFIRKAANWLLGKNSKGIVLSQSAIAHNLLALPPIQSIKEKINTSKFYATIDPFVLKEWKAERTKLIDEINQNPFARFDEETLRLFDLSNYLLSLRLQEIEKPAKSTVEIFNVFSTMNKTPALITNYLNLDNSKVNNGNLQAASESVSRFINRLGLPKSVLNTSLLIQFYAVPLADKLDGPVFAQHFTK